MDHSLSLCEFQFDFYVMDRCGILQTGFYQIELALEVAYISESFQS